jgi:hypothetical protein
MEERRKEDRRKLYGKPFLAMLIGGLPEDRRKGERRARVELATEGVNGPQSVETVSGDFIAAAEDVPAAH